MQNGARGGTGTSSCLSRPDCFRGAEERHDKRPQLSDLRESGSVEQDADVVILIHRPDLATADDPRAGEVDLIVAKHRNGRTATVTVCHQLHMARHADMARTENR